MDKIKRYFNILRIKHYIKNLLVVLPLFFNGQLCNMEELLKAIKGMLVFCCICSVVYIENDIFDLERDRMHPEKKERAIASGAVSVAEARVCAAVLLLIAVVMLFGMKATIYAVSLCGLYLVINLFYSCYGKHMPILDVAILSAGYPIRILFGGSITGTPVSSWLFLTTLCISLYFAFGKRWGELRMHQLQERDKSLNHSGSGGYGTRPILEQYHEEYLYSHMYLNLGLGIVFYSLWAIEKSQAFVYTVPFVILICMLYNFTMYKSGNGDPVNTVFSSLPILITGCVYMLFLFVMLYIR